jgi:hypothetical protein
LEEASAHAETITPIVSKTTEMICSGEKVLPRSQPAAIVVTLPKLRRMICAGTEILKANAQLLSILTAKNMAALFASFRRGIAVFFHDPFESNCDGRVNTVTRMNWLSVMSKPVTCQMTILG